MAGREEKLVKVQLDLVLTKDHWDNVTDTNIALPSRQKRNAVKEKLKLWPRRIPYDIDEKFDIEDRLLLVLAMKHWEEHTCLQFVEAKKHDYDVIQFVPDPSACESLLGRMQGKQPINLAPNCMHGAVIVHEIGHALGLYHEHMRADRDTYVTVNYENIDENYHPQFDKLKSGHYYSYNKPYDYESIMHYGKLYYSRNRREELLTIEPKNASYLNTIGNAESLSFYDVQIVSEMYECSRGCIPKQCPGNGFLGKNCECYCPGANMYDIILCDEKEKCGHPNISLSDYFVFIINTDVNVTEWSNETFYNAGTTFVVQHKKNISCGLETSNFNCTDGQWMGEFPPCEKACVVEEFSDDYSVINDDTGEIAKPGETVVSASAIYVSCKQKRRKDAFPDEFYLECSDGKWSKNISDIECQPCVVEEFSNDYSVINDDTGEIAKPGETVVSASGIYVSCKQKKRKDAFLDEFYLECSGGEWSKNISDIECQQQLCTMVLNAQIKGTFDEGFTVTCFQGYELEEQGGPGNKFTCSWGGIWEPVTPKCNPASCIVPDVSNSKFYGKNGDVFNGADVIVHGSDVTLKCDRRYIPVEKKLPCSFGKWMTSDGQVPKCELASCNVPPINDGTLYATNDEVFNDPEVLHGNDVTLKCNKGHVPDEATLTCRHRTWNTKDGIFPKCNLVECPPPTVVKTRGYKPRKDKYIYGDTVSVHFCQGSLFLEGSSKLECQKTGNWSDSAICKPFCSQAEKFKIKKNMAIQKGVRYKKLGLGSYAACERACKSFKRFLCLSFVYGVNNGQHQCKLYRWNAEKIPHIMEKKSFWTIGIRTCASRQ
ncbi:uncharacterized protein LOC132717732 isoform X2 [Ruditapes philippinarum]|nr:uncharacterized protein LOC132717732 isoform X2 [Ruditapes philippinarum]